MKEPNDEHELLKEIARLGEQIEIRDKLVMKQSEQFERLITILDRVTRIWEKSTVPEGMDALQKAFQDQQFRAQQGSGPRAPQPLGQWGP